MGLFIDPSFSEFIVGGRSEVGRSRTENRKRVRRRLINSLPLLMYSDLYPLHVLHTILVVHRRGNNDPMSTSRSDITAWALIALAAEPYVVSVLGTYTPILLEQLARENGVLASDRLTPCVIKGPPEDGPIPRPPPPGLSTSSADSCLLPILGGRVYIDTSSYALYTFSFSVLLQTICVLTISGIADNSQLKKRLILLSGTIGGAFTMMFCVIGSHNYYAASLLAVVANCAFGSVNVLMNSYLTLLINNYPFRRTAIDDVGDENDQLLPIGNTELGKVGSKISGIGTTTGYSAALAIQIISLLSLPILKDINNDMIWCVKIIISSIGFWWLIWQIPIGICLRNIVNENGMDRLPLKGMVLKGYKDLGHAMASIKNLKDIYFFLLGWFVISDSITTINSTAILFAKTTLHMPMVSLAKIGVLVMMSAISGSIIIPNVIIGWLQFDLQHALIGLILWCLCVPLYGIVALSTRTEMYVLAIWYGLGLGGLSTVSRSIYSIIIPKGKESVFFSIFSLTDKTSSIVGPLVIGLIINLFHELRGAFWVLAALLIISIPIVTQKFDLSRARKEAEDFD